MLDYYLSIKALKNLLNNLTNQSDIERYTAHTTIIHLSDEIGKILKDRGVQLKGAREKIALLHLHAAQACGLVASELPLDQRISQCHSSLTGLEQMLERLDVDLSSQ